jgi:CelD/BcsL family acetyltransferase involved in cellulose biosynthesis
MTRALTFATVRDPKAFAAMEPEWWALWHRSSSPTPFQSPAWLLPWWEAFAPGELCVVTIRDGDRLVALAPCYIDAAARERRILPIGISISDYQDIILDSAYADAAVACLQKDMPQIGSWDAWEFPELAPDAQALRLIAPSGYEADTEPCTACPVLALPPGPETLPGTIPVRKRRALRTARNRADRRGPVELIAAADEDSALAAFDMLIRLHRARWESKGESGVLADPRVRQFHRSAIPRLLRSGLLRIYMLRIAGHAAAVYYGFLLHDRAYGYLTGFDPAYEFESPSVILLGHAIAEAVRQKAREFHFLRGREPYKYGWGATDRWNQHRVFRPARAYANAS